MALPARYLLILRPARTGIVYPWATVTSRGGSSVRARSGHALTTRPSLLSPAGRADGFTDRHSSNRRGYLDLAG
jgi:hypothetical protein